MRSLFYVLSALAVIGLAYWAYHENYRTQAAISHAERLETRISTARQRLRVLNAEWAYLNRPARLRELADINFDRLELMPLEAGQFGRIDQVDFPPEVDLRIDFSASVEVSSGTEEVAE
ncbi:cell division protein FtsL [Pelagivirga sediminicola]|uniref:Cell division protein FtsL n=1 Tax=Pelagivirga sediminicola TaxID=2170575 RepID=A0A2T7GC04_9RHOB|nr:cell division protein FtsL [Pelagivirga sediminicola]PVA11960.1 cell division protein FtsL [Pelagivirga sediminicola]